MRHVVVYHNPERMGRPPRREPVVLTNKRVGRDAVGSRVWLITGEGRPRRFYLRGTFTLDRVESGADEGFLRRVRGREARFFSPMVDLTDTEWFADFKRSQGSFAFGFQAVRDPRFVAGLEAAAR